jgi:hypothetical protein
MNVKYIELRAGYVHSVCKEGGPVMGGKIDCSCTVPEKGLKKAS